MMNVKEIKLFVTDVDGVLTDSGYIYDQSGNVYKKFNTRDFFAINFVRNELKIPVMGLSGATDEATINKFKSASLTLHYGITKKLSFMKNLVAEMNISFSNVLFVGDHWIDINLLSCVGIKACPNDAIEDVKKMCDFVSSKKGGEGVLDDLVFNLFGEDFVVASKEKYN